MVSMYPNSMRTDYSQHPFIPFPPSVPCTPCGPRCASKFAKNLSLMGFSKFADIARISGLTNLDDRDLTVFAVADEDIPCDFIKSCNKLKAVNVIRSSTMERIIPVEVLAQSENSFCRSMNRSHQLHIVFRNGKMYVDGRNVKQGNIEGKNIMIHKINAPIVALSTA